jgi:hypothetical protein
MLAFLLSRTFYYIEWGIDFSQEVRYFYYYISISSENLLICISAWPAFMLGGAPFGAMVFKGCFRKAACS